MNLRSFISRNLINIPGWRTNRKIIVIESDDWGSIRMPSKEVYQKLLEAGIKVNKCHFNSYDALASEDDLIRLFETLRNFKDLNGNHPVITANTIVANPDFRKIKDSGFKEYYYELFTETLKHYPKHSNAFELWKQGMTEGVFRPQFHGREHLNVKRWLKVLQSGSKETLMSFENEMFGISTSITTESRKSFLAALDFDDISELEWQKEMLTDGLKLFEKLFGYSSKTYIATNYVWHPEVEKQLHYLGVKAIQGGNAQLIPDLNYQKKHVRHKLGEKNQWGQSYLIRNVSFEPSQNEKKDWLNHCLKEIEIAFFWNKPAVFNSHRVNYIGFINESNRKKNLLILNQLLTAILKKWPNVEFMSSDQLTDLIRSESQ